MRLPESLESRTVAVAAKFVKPLAPIRVRAPRAPARPPRGGEYRAMLDAEPGLTRAELARRLGVSRASVTQALRRRQV